MFIHLVILFFCQIFLQFAKLYKFKSLWVTEFLEWMEIAKPRLEKFQCINASCLAFLCSSLSLPSHSFPRMISVFLSLTGVETLQRDRVTAVVTQISKIAWRKKRLSACQSFSFSIVSSCMPHHTAHFPCHTPISLIVQNIWANF